jgi:2-polyprenyl-6-methoxyphenol hydroxylase-like FAD-dependent oxidoreductase
MTGRSANPVARGASDAVVHVQCAIAGGGPAGMMLGWLLARAGVTVVVLEKHRDFLRDFRGDTIHPSTLEILYELGVLEEFLKRPHREIRELTGRVGRETLTLGDFSHLPTRCKFIALMPQWDFLNFVASQAQAHSTFRLLMQAEVTGLQESNGRVRGLIAAMPDGSIAIDADLVVGADGRRSDVRAKAGLPVEDLGAPMDVLWMRISRNPADPEGLVGNLDSGIVFVMIDRGDYWQCAFAIPKGGIDDIHARGLPQFRDRIRALVPFLGNRVDELSDWNEIKLLTVVVDRLRTWHKPGLLCIGDAAHAMSPVGGVGINLAIQDAVAAANILAAPLASGRLSDNDLVSVQRRRELPTRVIQRGQVALQNLFLKRALENRGEVKVPLAMRLLQRFPVLRRIPARLVGVGIRPEHVRLRTLPSRS